MSQGHDTGPRPLYAVTIHDAICSGDLAKMKQIAAEAEEYLAKAGHLPAALQALKVEIAKAEHK